MYFLIDYENVGGLALPPKRLYPEALHCFGRVDELTIYRIRRKLPNRP